MSKRFFWCICNYHWIYNKFLPCLLNFRIIQLWIWLQDILYWVHHHYNIHSHWYTSHHTLTQDIIISPDMMYSCCRRSHISLTLIPLLILTLLLFYSYWLGVSFLPHTMSSWFRRYRLTINIQCRNIFCPPGAPTIEIGDECKSDVFFYTWT